MPRTDPTCFRFTQRALEQLGPHAKDARATELELTDLETPGLKLLVGKNGSKKFLFRYSFGGRKRGLALGPFGPVSLTEARRLANLYRAQVAQGTDPKAEREARRDRMTLAGFALTLYLPHAQNLKRSAKDDEAKLRLHLLPTLGKRPLEEISRLELEQYLNRIAATHTPASVNRHRSLVHRMFRLAMDWGYAQDNPAKHLAKRQENNQRQRFLSPEEIRRLFLAADEDENTVAAGMVKFLLLTGTRRAEAQFARWEHVDSERGVWYVPHTKAGRARYVTLNPLALRVLAELPRVKGNPFVFPGAVENQAVHNPTKAFKRILKRAGIESSFRMHDLRHTVASLIVNNGGTLYDVQATLGHSTSRMSERYAHLSNERMRHTGRRIAEAVGHALDAPR